MAVPRQPFSRFFCFSRLCKSGNLEESGIVEIEIPWRIERGGKEDSGSGIQHVRFRPKDVLNTGRMIILPYDGEFFGKSQLFGWRRQATAAARSWYGLPCRTEARRAPGSPGCHDLSDMFDIFEKLVEIPEDS